VRDYGSPGERFGRGIMESFEGIDIYERETEGTKKRIVKTPQLDRLNHLCKFSASAYSNQFPLLTFRE
jgi:hypothetical protein